MKKFLILPCGLALLLALLACGGPGETVEAATEPEDRLRAMSDLLAGAASLRLEARESFQWHDEEGQAQSLQAVWEVTIWRPDALRVTMTSEGSKTYDVDLYYDGWMLTFVDHDQQVWAWAEAPRTLDELLDELYPRFNLPFPMKDILYASPYDQLETEDTASRLAGREELEGRPCDRLAFTHAAVDWEIWIEAAGQPLPRRLDIIHKALESKPTSEIVFTEIDLAPEVEDALFTFDPPEGYTNIPAVENPPPGEGEEPPAGEGEAGVEGSES